MSELKNQMVICVGDDSGDGHCLSRDFSVRSNLTADEVQDVYKKAVKKTKFNFDALVCAKSEDYTDEWIMLFNGPHLYDAKYHWTSLK